MSKIVFLNKSQDLASNPRSFALDRTKRGGYADGHFKLGVAPALAKSLCSFLIKENKGGDFMLNKIVVMSLAFFLVLGGIALAGEGKGNLSGEITKIDGDMVTVKTEDGEDKKIHVDSASTKKEGNLEVGTHIAADVTSKGHANWIKEIEEDEEE
ncbi:MAG TPA: hypothetical protein VGB26_00475 [Nitrospiria bacterium]